MSFSQNTSFDLRHAQRLTINQAMKQSLDVLQMPVIELGAYLKIQIELNPVFDDILCHAPYEMQPCCDPKELDFERSGFEVLDFLDENFTLGLFPESTPDHQAKTQNDVKSLYRHLIEQIPCFFNHASEQEIAFYLIGNLDEKGFLTLPLEELSELYAVPKSHLESLLRRIQQMDPPGIGARSLRESLLIQLIQQGKRDSLSYRIIDEHYEDLLYNRLPQIQKKMKVAINEIKHTIFSEIKTLSLSPASNFDHEPLIYLEPDILLQKKEGQWEIQINSSCLPKMALSPFYAKLMQDASLSLEDRKELRKLMASGKWLYRTVYKRNHTLLGIAKKILSAQNSFLEGEVSHPVPMKVKEVADQLNLHESTVSRAVANKSISLPQGVFPLKMFFERRVVKQLGDEVHSSVGKEQILKIIEKEDKNAPFSDQSLSLEMQKMGLQLARRTIAKYRNELNIPSASKRRHWN